MLPFSSRVNVSFLPFPPLTITHHHHLSPLPPPPLTTHHHSSSTGGELFELLNAGKNEGFVFREDRASQLMRDMLSAVHYLHSKVCRSLQETTLRQNQTLTHLAFTSLNYIANLNLCCFFLLNKKSDFCIIPTFSIFSSFLQGILHRDLKLENFLFEEKNCNSPLVLIDFGLSKHFDPEDKLTHRGRKKKTKKKTRSLICYYFYYHVLIMFLSTA